MKKLTRQRLWQIQQVEKGLCSQCARPLSPHSSNFCEEHMQKNRRNSLIRTREKKGIPIDAPLRATGRRRKENAEILTEEQKSLLGTQTDKVLGEKWNLDRGLVTRERNKLGIKPYRKHS